MMCARCVSAVRTEMKSICAISWFVWPSASSREHLPLAIRERILLGGLLAPRRRRRPCARRAPGGRSSLRAATSRTADDQLGVRRLLQHVAAGSGCESLAHVAGIVLHREDRAPSRPGCSCRSSGVTSIPLLPAEHDVHEHDVRLRASRLEDRLARVAGLADRLDVLLGVEEQAKPGPDDGVVVDDENPDAHRTGTSTTSVVPLPVADSIVTDPSEERDALAHPDEADASVRVALGVEAPPVVLDDRADRVAPSA